MLAQRMLGRCFPAVVAVAVLSFVVPPAASGGVSVIGDDDADRYIGSGAVILPVVVDPTTRAWASTCAGCRWKVTAPCRRDDEYGDAGCRGTVLGCPQGREISRAWLARPGEAFQAVGLFCPSDGDVTSVADATSRVRGGFERFLPALTIECAPPQGAVVGIPLHCRSLQDSGHVTWADSVSGYQVRTTARAAWTWTFRQLRPDGSTGARWSHDVTEPGRPYPSAGVRQGFSEPGIHHVDVVARWRGSFTVDGLGPFAIAQEMEQRAALRVPTGSALGVMGAPARG